MKPLTLPGIEPYAHEHTHAEPDYLEALERRTHAEMKQPQMLTGRIEGRLLKLVVAMVQPRLVVEVGTFTGYSALSMAEGLPPGGRILTCEIDPVAQRVAQEAIEASPFAGQVEIRPGPALATIESIDEPIDLAFIDADKTGYLAYYEAILSRMPAGGVILLDNMLWSGRVLEPGDEDTRALAELNDRIARDDRVENVLLTVRDGIQLVRKR